MTYHYTRKILWVERILGHKRIESAMKYLFLVQFKDHEFDVETAQSIEEAKDLLKASFGYVRTKDNLMLFRRPRTFGPALGFFDKILSGNKTLMVKRCRIMVKLIIVLLSKDG
jgi:hypothetical protein